MHEHMVHQCVSENLWFLNILGIDVGAPPLPAREVRWEFMARYAEDSGKRLALQVQPENWWEEPSRSSHTAMLRMLGHDMHSTYGPTADTGG